MENHPVVLVRDPVKLQKIPIPKAHHKLVIGKRGEKLRSLEKLTATRINVPSLKDESNLISIMGARDGIKQAIKEIRLISEQQAKLVSERLVIPRKYHPFIAGRHNLHINKLSKDLEVRINIPSPSTATDEIQITGSSENVAQTVKIINKQYEDLLKLDYTAISLEVEKSQHKYLIGQNIKNVREIFAKTGVSVEVPTIQSSSETIVLRGPADALEAAEKLVQKKLQAGNNSNFEIIYVNSKFHKFLIGRNGTNMKRIHDSTGVRLIFPPPEGDPDNPNQIKITGKQESIEEAKKLIQNILDNLIVDSEIDVDPKYHHHFFLGRRKILRQLQEEFSTVTLTFPKVGGGNNGSSTESVTVRNPSLITLRGNSSQVEAAKLKIASIIEDLVTKSMTNAQKADIDTEKPKPRPQRPVRNKRVKFIKDANNNAVPVPIVNNNIKEEKKPFTVDINPKVYSRIIGLMGRSVAQLQKDYNVHIQFPKPTDEHPTLVNISGKDKNDILAASKVLKELEEKYMAETNGQMETQARNKLLNYKKLRQPVQTSAADV